MHLPREILDGQYDPYNEFRRNPINPLQNLWGFVTRKDIDQDGSFCDPPQWAAQHEITVEQGLRLLTIEPAYAVSQDDVLGTLKAGKFADIVILDRNPLAVSSDEILELSVLMTMVGGNVEFCREGNEALCPETPTTSVRTMDSSIPGSYALQQNYPNPFNPSTTIEFSLRRSSYVTLNVYNTLGEEVATLASEVLSVGSYSVEWDASGVSSGIYFYRLQAGEFVETKKLVLVK